VVLEFIIKITKKPFAVKRMAKIMNETGGQEGDFENDTSHKAIRCFMNNYGQMQDYFKNNIVAVVVIAEIEIVTML
jgi:hypothetical protein